MQLKAFRKKKTIIIGAVVLGLITIVILSKAVQKKEGEPVQVGKVERRARLESKVTASGEIRPVKFYNLTAEVPGRVEQIFVSEGDVVKKGQELVRVDPTQSTFAVSAGEASVRVSQSDVANQQVALQQAENNVNQARANLAGAESDLERTKADLLFAESEYNRYQQLSRTASQRNRNSIPQNHGTTRRKPSSPAQQSRIKQLNVLVKDAELGVERSRAALQSSNERVKQGQADLSRQADQLKKTTRFSPIDGVVSASRAGR